MLFVGLTDVAEAMIVSEVFISVADGGYMVDVTNLSAETIRHVDFDYRESPKTFLSDLMDLKPYIATEVLMKLPMSFLAKRRWRYYQYFTTFWAIFHFLFFVFYTTETIDYDLCCNGTVPANTTNLDDYMEISTSNKIWEICVLTYATICMAYLIITFVKEFKFTYEGARSCVFALFSVELVEEYDIQDEYSFYSFPVYFTGHILNHANLILLFGLFTSSLITVIKSNQDEYDQTYLSAKGISVLLGWVLLFMPVRTFWPIYNLLQTIRLISVKVLVPFVIFYIFINMAFSAAIQLQIQLMRNSNATVIKEDDGLDELHDDLSLVMWEFLMLTFSLQSKFTDVNDIKGLDFLFNM